jgi:hypothetical protein
MAVIYTSRLELQMAISAEINKQKNESLYALNRLINAMSCLSERMPNDETMLNAEVELRDKLADDMGIY